MRLKIVYILSSVSMGGATISFINLLKGMIINNIDPLVILPQKDTALIKLLEDGGARCFVVPIESSIFPIWRKNYFFYDLIMYPFRLSIKLINKRRSYYALYNICKNEQPDIIHTNVGVIHEGFKVARKMNIPHIWHLREYQDLDFSWKIYPSKGKFINMLKQSFVITITNDIRRHFQLLDYSNAITIYNGIYSKSDTCCLFPKNKYFLCASRISPEKGHDGIIKAFAKFLSINPDYKLTILGFGETDYLNKLHKLSTALGCNKSIEWIGYTENVKEYMKRAKALIINSSYEGFGRMTAEACFNGCIVVGRNTGGTKEILEKTGGLLFNDENHLYQRMIEVSKIPDNIYRESVSLSCNIAQKEYSIEQNVEKTYRLYKDILNNNQLYGLN